MDTKGYEEAAPKLALAITVRFCLDNIYMEMQEHGYGYD